MMYGLAWKTIRERRASFFGSIGAVVLGTAVLTAAVSMIVAVGGSEFPGAGQNAKGGVIALLIFITVIAAFLSVFLVSSTVSFSVATRGRELALFRVVGGTSAQVRSLVRAETTIVALLGGVAGLLVGYALGALTGTILGATDLGAGLEYELSGAMIPIATPIGFGVGLLVTFIGARSAAKRVSNVPLMDALTEVDLDRGVMSARRWIFAFVFLALGIGLMVLVPQSGPDGLVPLGIFLGLPLVLCAGLLAPVLVRPFSAVLAALLARFAAAPGWVAARTVRQSIRRSAAVTVPVLLVVGVAGSIVGTAGVFGAATQSSMDSQYRSDIVAAAAPGREPDLEAVRGVPGVGAASIVGQAELRVSTDGPEPDREVGVSTVAGGELASVFALREVSGAAEGEGIVAGRSTASTLGWEQGADIAVRRADGSVINAPLLATFADNPLQENVIVPAELAGSGPAEGAMIHIGLATGADPDDVRDGLTEVLGGQALVQATEDWTAAVGDGQSSGLRSGAWVLAGIALAYAGLSVVNTTFMSFRDRRQEFAQLSRIGATGRQIRWIVGWESAVVAGIGVLIGGVIAIATSTVLSAALGGVAPEMSLTLPIGELLILGAISVGLSLIAGQVAIPREVDPA